MQKNTAIAAAGALVLTAAGGVAVLSETVSATPAPTEVVIEYVDQFGNPIDPTKPPAAETTVVVVPAVEATMPSPAVDPPTTAYVEEGYEASDHEESEEAEHEENETHEEEEEDHDD